jgi:large subunit ribosomal protein L25
MSKNYALSAEKRDRAGKGVARALRRDKKIPAVVYGDGKEPVLISMTEKEIAKEYQRGFMYTHLCDLMVDGVKQLCIARDIQLHPVTDRIEHADFLRVTPKTKIVVDVPVQFLNQETCPGLKAGGLLNVVSHELPVLCSATDIPDSIDVDLATAEIGDSLRLGQTKLRSSAIPVDNDPEFVLATILAPKSAAADEAADAAVATAAAAASAAPLADGVKKEEKK